MLPLFPGTEPLIKIASGGEMSRIMLAIKSIISSFDQIPIIVFDEIDTGISGLAANKVGKKIQGMHFSLIFTYYFNVIIVIIILQTEVITT